MLRNALLGFLILFAGNLLSQPGPGGNFKRSFEVSGKVVNAEGQSIKNARIALYRMADTFYKVPTEDQLIQFPNEVIQESIFSVLTDETGGFTQTVSMPLFRFPMPEVQPNPDGGRMRRRPSPHSFSAYLVVSADGYKPLKGYVNWRPTGGWENPTLSIEPMVLLKASDVLNEVEIKTQVIKQKGDTTEMNASSFKVNPDATAEDLVRKMPGITSSNGQVQAQGEQVKKVLVDGKPFFGDDPNTALKNLPADVVSKIQVYDGKSDQAAFTGFDDGNTNKTINIITKMGIKKGQFGKFFGGFGRSIDGSGDVNKYKGGLNFSSFNGDRRITFLSQLNNINEQNFSIDDIMGAMNTGRGGGGGGMGGGRMFNGAGGGGMDPSQFFVGNQGGITTTMAAGLNFSDKWGKRKRLEVSASYFLNNTDNDNSSNTYRYYVLGNNSSAGALNYSDTSMNKSHNRNHRINMRFDWKADTFNRFIIQPRLTIQQNEAYNPLVSKTFPQENPIQILSKLVNDNTKNSTGYNGGLNFTWMRSFEKKGRTISVNVNPAINHQGSTNLVSNTIGFSQGSIYKDTTKKQSTETLKDVKTLSANLTFTEGLDSNNLVSVLYNLNVNQNNSDRRNRVPTILGGDYNRLDTLLSNTFNNGYSSHQIGTQYMYQNYKWNISFGVNGQYANLNGIQQFPFASDINRNFYSVLPNFNIRYKMGMKRNLRLNYRTSNNAPSVDQLQEVVNNSNLLQLTTGNKALVQDFSHNFTMRYFTVNIEKSTNGFVMVNAQVSQNYITSLTQIAAQGPLTVLVNDTHKIKIAPGGQMSRPVNMDGYYNFRVFGTYGSPLLKSKWNMNINAGINYTQTPSQIQMGQNAIQNNFARNPSANVGLVLGSNIETVDVTLMSTTTYSKVINTAQANLNQSYVNQNSQFKLSWMPAKAKKKLVIATDVTHQLYTGLSTNYNQSYFLWNAALAKKFGKANQAELRLYVYDLLNQNRSIQRNVTQTYFEDVKTKVLTRYFMLTFTYTFRKLPGMPEENKEDKMRRMMFPGGGGPPMGMPPPGHGGF